jgi:hypothetical protein
MRFMWYTLQGDKMLVPTPLKEFVVCRNMNLTALHIITMVIRRLLSLKLTLRLPVLFNFAIFFRYN